MMHHILVAVQTKYTANKILIFHYKNVLLGLMLMD